MAQEPGSDEPTPPRGRSTPPLRHHLEDGHDRVLDRRFGTGAARRRRLNRRQEQYARLAERLFEQLLLGELGHPDAEGLRLHEVELHPGGNLLTVWFALPPERSEEDPRAVEQRLASATGFLRDALAQHLRTKRTPLLRVRVRHSEC